MGWRKHVSDAMYDALCAVFEMDPNSAEAMRKFVPAYIKDTTNVQAPRNLDICYYDISRPGDTDQDYIQVLPPKRGNNTKTTIKKTIPVSVLFTFYGENADDESEEFWSLIQWDKGAGSARAILRSKKIVLYGKPIRPVPLFEVEGTFHRRRCDVRVNFAYLCETAKEANYVEHAPDVDIVTNYD